MFPVSLFLLATWCYELVIGSPGVWARFWYGSSISRTLLHKLWLHKWDIWEKKILVEGNSNTSSIFFLYTVMVWLYAYDKCLHPNWSRLGNCSFVCTSLVCYLCQRFVSSILISRLGACRSIRGVQCQGYSFKIFIMFCIVHGPWLGSSGLCVWPTVELEIKC